MCGISLIQLNRPYHIAYTKREAKIKDGELYGFCKNSTFSALLVVYMYAIMFRYLGIFLTFLYRYLYRYLLSTFLLSCKFESFALS